MKIYVCYKSYPYEGCSEPLEAFTDEEKAKAWIKDNDHRDIFAEYVELEIG